MVRCDKREASSPKSDDEFLRGCTVKQKDELEYNN